ncbi:hypothetical protein QAD02_020279 [Eretmocerus hayati]|uniref:Uncharacterized protein n=1 Tax=Eretmocerus hayati TaxID=131215 RepID=A0ACC2PM68_9HYME|nr:hypothetical protein QAD02_020279 [Eretmocerus hayati]
MNTEKCIICDQNLADKPTCVVGKNELKDLIDASRTYGDGRKLTSFLQATQLKLHISCYEEYIGGKCPICNNRLRSKPTLTAKNDVLAKITSASLQRKDELHKKWEKVTEIEVHTSCRKVYTRETSIAAYLRRKQEEEENQRDVDERFDSSVHCILCAEKVDPWKKPARKITQQATLDKLALSLDKMCNKPFYKSAKSRVDNIPPVSPESVPAVYHRLCMCKLYKDIDDKDTRAKRGRPYSDSTSHFMIFLHNYLSKNVEECQFSLCDMKSRYLKNNPNNEVPRRRQIKLELIKYYGADIVFYDVGQDLIFCMKGNTLQIRNEHWFGDKPETVEEENSNIINVASAIVLEEIREKQYDTKYYEPPSIFLDGAKYDIPPSLYKFIYNVIASTKTKPSDWTGRVIAICHCIIASARPRSFLSSVLISIAVMLHGRHGAKDTIQQLWSYGLCASYDEALIFQNSILNDPENFGVSEDSYSQWMVDNLDANLQTIDGKNTLHVLGNLRVVTPDTSVTSTKKILRITKFNSRDITGSKLGFVPTKVFDRGNSLGLKGVKIQDVRAEFQRRFPDSGEGNEIRYLNLLWSIYKNREPSFIVGWHGYLGTFFRNDTFRMSKAIPLQVINAPPSEYNTVFTALVWIAAMLGEMEHQNHGVVTMDQPLYAKGREIYACLSDTEDKYGLRWLILRIGELHLLMSFGGVIGNIMDCSGLLEAFSVIYAELSAAAALTGSQIKRAIRGHVLVQLALSNSVITSLDLTDDEKNYLDTLQQKIFEPDYRPNLRDDEFCKNLSDKFSLQLNKLRENGPTAGLWVQYIEMVTLFKTAIAAIRTGNWPLHLRTVKDMLPYFHAAGHNNYAKYAHLYLQDMLELKDKMSPSEYDKLVNQSYYVIRRTNYFFGAIASDHAIESMYMRLLKATGGIIQRGASEAVITKFIASQVSVSAVMNSIEKFTGISRGSSEQHTDARDHRIQKDAEDLKNLLQFFESHNPFPKSPYIMSITSNVVGDDRVINCHKALEVGTKLFEKMSDHSDGIRTFGNIKFKRSDKVKSLRAVSSAVNVDEEVIEVDTMLIFSRMVSKVTSPEDIKKYLEYELSAYPASIFNEAGMLKTQKSNFYEEFEIADNIPLDKLAFVIDGGFLLHRVVWNQGENIQRIISRYIAFVKKHYLGDDICIIFDGYPDNEYLSTKSFERFRRNQKSSGAQIEFDASTPIHMKKVDFLSNEMNKKRLINLLSKEFQNHGICTTQAEEDADVLIIQTSIEMACVNSDRYVVVVGEDIDLLVIMNELASAYENIYFLKPRNASAKDGDDHWYKSSSFVHSILNNLVGFLHVFTGCDTTSTFFKRGKKKFCQLMSSHEEMQKLASYFYDPQARKDIISSYGCKLVAYMYSDGLSDNLHEVRVNHYYKNLKAKSFDLKNLPPTKQAAEQHAFRVYYELQKIFNYTKNPLDWGWKKTDYGLRPVPITDRGFLIPKDILLMISCSCTTGCQSKRCSCRKRGLKCSDLCKHCFGNDCSNFEHPEYDPSCPYSEEQQESEVNNVDQMINNIIEVYTRDERTSGDELPAQANVMNSENALEQPMNEVDIGCSPMHGTDKCIDLRMDSNERNVSTVGDIIVVDPMNSSNRRGEKRKRSEAEFITCLCATECDLRPCRCRMNHFNCSNSCSCCVAKSCSNGENNVLVHGVDISNLDVEFEENSENKFHMLDSILDLSISCENSTESNYEKSDSSLANIDTNSRPNSILTNAECVTVRNPQNVNNENIGLHTSSIMFIDNEIFNAEDWKV